MWFVGSEKPCIYSVPNRKQSYDIETTQDKYRLAMEIIMADTTDAGNVGIRSLYIIRFEDDTDQNCAYRGDGAYTPGINIGKVQENAEF